MTTIQMVEFTKDYKIPQDGKYLVKTQSTSIFKTIQYLQARCSLVNDKTTIDVSNQVVLEISKEPII